MMKDHGQLDHDAVLSIHKLHNDQVIARIVKSSSINDDWTNNNFSYIYINLYIFAINVYYLTNCCKLHR